VVVDEGQSIDAGEVVALFGAVDPQVRYVKVIAETRECAFEHIAGHWIAYR
jgi:hypothetical protein